MLCISKCWCNFLNQIDFCWPDALRWAPGHYGSNNKLIIIHSKIAIIKSIILIIDYLFYFFIKISLFYFIIHSTCFTLQSDHFDIYFPSSNFSHLCQSIRLKKMIILSLKIRLFGLHSFLRLLFYNFPRRWQMIVQIVKINLQISIFILFLFLVVVNNYPILGIDVVLFIIIIVDYYF